MSAVAELAHRPEDAPSGDLAVRSMRAIGTTATVAVTDEHRADEALALLAGDLRALDEACSRFRPDSELRRVEAYGAGGPVAVSPLLYELLEVACQVATDTAGIVDPTIGSALVELGYDRDFVQIGSGDQVGEHDPRPAPGWWRIGLNPEARSVTIPIGVHVDLGATAKAFAADRAAARMADGFGCGVLVNLGGDVAVAGPHPRDGWPVGIAAECATSVNQVEQVVTIVDGGLASSGTTARSWMRNGRRVHHIVDPWTGRSAPAVWALVSVAAPSCVVANAWSTAAVVWGEDAVGNLSSWGVPARLVDVDGNVVRCGGWPPDGDAPSVAHGAYGRGPAS
jgi:FAD:protein FMN transferase